MINSHIEEYLDYYCDFFKKNLPFAVLLKGQWGCGKKFRDYGEPDYHHKELYSKGGRTSVENITILCKDCHHKIHGNEKIKLTYEDEELEVE